MTDDLLISRNDSFATGPVRERAPRIPFIPRRQLYVLTCIDPRVEPAAALGLDYGDAIVARTVGGRAHASFLDDLGWICYLHERLTPDAAWFDLAVVHHTDCGSAFMADDELRAGFVARGHDDAVLRATAVVDPGATVRADVATILDAPQLTGPVRVSGYVLDLATGRLRAVCGPGVAERPAA